MTELNIERIYNELQEINEIIKERNALAIDINKLSMQDLIKLLLNKVEILEKSNKTILQKLDDIQCKDIKNDKPINPYCHFIQQIDPNTFELVQAYPCFELLIIDNPTFNSVMIDKAVKENTICHGFRWNYVYKELNVYKVDKLPPTVTK
jgi:hypothetical protein